MGMEVISLKWIRQKAMDKIYRGISPTKEDVELIKRWFKIMVGNLEKFEKLGKENVVKLIRDELATARKYCEVMGIKDELSEFYKK